MKRKLAALMTVILVLSLAVAAIVPALAAESTGEAETGDVLLLMWESGNATGSP